MRTAKSKKAKRIFFLDTSALKRKILIVIGQLAFVNCLLVLKGNLNN